MISRLVSKFNFYFIRNFQNSQLEVPKQILIYLESIILDKKQTIYRTNAKHFNLHQFIYIRSFTFLKCSATTYILSARIRKLKLQK